MQNQRENGRSTVQLFILPEVGYLDLFYNRTNMHERVTPGKAGNVPESKFQVEWGGGIRYRNHLHYQETTKCDCCLKRIQ